MLRSVTIVRTDVSEERSASFIKGTWIGELRTMLAVNINRRTLRRNTMIYSYSASVAWIPIWGMGRTEFVSDCDVFVYCKCNRTYRYWARGDKGDWFFYFVNSYSPYRKTLSIHTIFSIIEAAYGNTLTQDWRDEVRGEHITQVGGPNSYSSSYARMIKWGRLA
jgi:hypothetical protein